MLETLLGDYRRLLAGVDAWFEGCLERAGGEIACRQGCSGCCRGLFDITLLDALLLRQGFERMEEPRRQAVLVRVGARMAELQRRWPGFDHPFRVDLLPAAEVATLQAADEVPCVLLGEDGRCLLYAERPLTCRLHGLPHVDRSGEVFDAEGCTLNFPGADASALPELRWEFRAAFAEEGRLLRAAILQLTGCDGADFDTFIPTALLLDLDRLGGRGAEVDFGA